ncbi:MAG: DNA cytosine methyltransferase [Betaproteobacteria bacterium]|nr:DNA cytosine methyltransferase [Betaproteobacteria bacterium]
MRIRLRIDYLFKNALYELPNSHRPPCHQNDNHSYKSMYGRLREDQPAQTITSGFGSMGQGRFVHPTRRRTITAHEAARIQGFPDFFSFEGIERVTALREMIGNAVPPPLAMAIVFGLLPLLAKR